MKDEVRMVRERKEFTRKMAPFYRCPRNVDVALAGYHQQTIEGSGK